MNVKTSAHKMIGFNAYNYATDKAQLLGGVEYQITGAYTALSFTDINGDSETITPDADGKFTPTNNGILTVTGGDDETTCVHIVWDGERNGEYEPYIAYNYPLQANLELRGIPKLDASNNLYYDGDEYTSNGKVTRKYGIVTLDGTENWYATDGYTNRFAVLTGLSNISDTYQNFISNRYRSTLWGTNSFTFALKTNGDLYLCLDTTATQMTLSDFKTWLGNNNLSIVYELATPTTETADTFTNPQQVDANGTEEYVDNRTVPIPVGHMTAYGDDIKGVIVDFGHLIYGGELNLTTGTLTSTKNADGTDKGTPDVYQVTPRTIDVRAGDNYIFGNTNGDSYVKYLAKA